MQQRPSGPYDTIRAAFCQTAPPGEAPGFFMPSLGRLDLVQVLISGGLEGDRNTSRLAGGEVYKGLFVVVHAVDGDPLGAVGVRVIQLGHQRGADVMPPGGGVHVLRAPAVDLVQVHGAGDLDADQLPVLRHLAADVDGVPVLYDLTLETADFGNLLAFGPHDPPGNE